jgi:hypothetical protein
MKRPVNVISDFERGKGLRFSLEIFQIDTPSPTSFVLESITDGHYNFIGQETYGIPTDTIGEALAVGTFYEIRMFREGFLNN